MARYTRRVGFLIAAQYTIRPDCYGWYVHTPNDTEVFSGSYDQCCKWVKSRVSAQAWRDKVTEYETD